MRRRVLPLGNMSLQAALATGAHHSRRHCRPTCAEGNRAVGPLLADLTRSRTSASMAKSGPLESRAAVTAHERHASMSQRPTVSSAVGAVRILDVDLAGVD